MSQTERSESELAGLRKNASELAASRKERPTTIHLLAAIAGRPGPAADLLAERGLDKDALLKAGRTFDEETSDALGRALTAAKEVSKRARGPVSTDGIDRGRPSISPDSRLVHMEPTALHLLVALLAERRFAAFRALATFGIDSMRLRTSALTMALGFVPPRRDVARVQAAPVLPPRAGKSSPPSLTSALAPPRLPRISPHSNAPMVVPLLPPTRPSEPPPKRVQHARRPRPVAHGERIRPAKIDLAPSAKAETPSESPPPVLESGAAAPNETPLLKAIAIDPATRANTVVVGRDEEVERVLDVLAKHRANAPCLVGPAGVGKTTVAIGLAKTLEKEGAKLIEIPAASLVAGTAARGALAERVATMFEEARRATSKLVLFVDDLHELLAAGDEALAELKVQLARGDVRFVAATNTENLRRAVESDPQLSRRLVPIEIDEPNEEDAFLMLRAAAAVLEPHHGVRYEDEALAAAVGWSVRYLPNRALPDKGIGALDYAGARVQRAQGRSGAKRTTPAIVRIADVAEAMSELANVPRERLLETDRERMLRLESFLGERVVGHIEPLKRIARQLRKSAAGLRQRRPLGSFLLLGPTGVGKTESAKALAEALFGSADAMTRIDLSEFSEGHSIARLIGAPPGYVGHDAGGQLTEAVRKRPYQVLLLDEIEKAHQDVLLAFLQVLDEGHLTDGRGRRVDFTNVVIVCTSNLGSRDVASAVRGKSVGFAQSAAPSSRDFTDVAIAAAKRHLPLELFNRFDEVLFFAPLTREQVAEVARHALDDLAEVLSARGVRLELEDAVIEHLLDHGGFDPELGARPMKRTIARLVEGPVAELLLAQELTNGSVALLGVENGEIVVDSMRARASA